MEDIYYIAFIGFVGTVIVLISDYLISNISTMKNRRVRNWFSDNWIPLVVLGILIILYCLIYAVGIEFSLKKIETIASKTTIINDTSTNKSKLDSLPSNINFKDQISSNGSKGDTFGGTIGPLVAAIAAFLTFLAFWIQFTSNRQQRRDIKRERFENRFFKYMDYHRDNVNELSYRDPKEEKEKYYKGNQVFTVVYYEIKELYEEYIKNRYKDTKLNKEQKQEAINFTYNCIFFGAGKHSANILSSNFDCRHFDYIDFKERKAEYKFDGKNHIYYTGHVRRLGHYFRNIYQAVTYLDEQKDLTFREKYEYMTTFRAQMSVYEQAVFFFNSLSDLGKTWELDAYSDNVNRYGKKILYSEMHITKYDLIRNTLNHNGEITDGVFINDFYPLLNIEGKDECAKSAKLPFGGTDENDHICRFCYNRIYFDYDNREVERKVDYAYNRDPEQFKDFRCDEPSCRVTPIYNRLKKDEGTKEGA